jgi:hypothetical protein
LLFSSSYEIIEYKLEKRSFSVDYQNPPTPFDTSAVTCERVALAIALSAKLMGAPDEACAIPLDSADKLIAVLAASVSEVAEA